MLSLNLIAWTTRQHSSNLGDSPKVSAVVSLDSRSEQCFPDGDFYMTLHTVIDAVHWGETASNSMSTQSHVHKSTACLSQETRTMA